MSLKFKQDAEPVFTSETYYDLFDGGYIQPYELLEPEDATRVMNAVRLVQQFLDEAEEAELLEIG